MVINFKQRILGIVILVAIAAIFLPMLFTSSGSKHFKTKLSSNIPTPPAKPEVKYQRPPAVKTVVIPQSKPEAAPAKEAKQSTSKTSQAKTNAAPITTSTKRQQQTVHTSSVVKAPVTKTVKTPLVQKTPAQKQTAKAQVTQSKTAAKKPQALPAELPLAWVVQVGSFSDKANVNRLVAKLRRANFEAFTESEQTAKGEMMKVLIGPALQRVQAQKIQHDLMQKLNMRGFVSRYKVKA